MTKHAKSNKQSYGGTRRGKRSKNGNSKKLDTIKDSKENGKTSTDGGHCPNQHGTSVNSGPEPQPELITGPANILTVSVDFV